MDSKGVNKRIIATRRVAPRPRITLALVVFD